MAKHKRKGLEGTGKESKRQKITPAEETPRTSEAGPDKETASTLVQEASPELSPEERRVLERKLKKERKKEEKKRLREAGIAATQTAKVQTLPAKPSAATLALEYLQGWAQKQESWRFQKTRQTWLLLHMYDEDKVCAHGWAKGGWGAVGHSGHRVSAWQVGTWVSGSMHSTWTTKQSS
uniref:Cholesin n=1 Tax=Mus musculus TaxID=10090 RepID=A0A0G2JEY4_MOUSE